MRVLIERLEAQHEGELVEVGGLVRATMSAAKLGARAAKAAARGIGKAARSDTGKKVGRLAAREGAKYAVRKLSAAQERERKEKRAERYRRTGE